MATISLTIPDAALPRVIDALCARGHWSTETGVAKGPYAKTVLAQWLKEEVQRYEKAQAEQAALAAVTPPAVVDIS